MEKFSSLSGVLTYYQAMLPPEKNNFAWNNKTLVAYWGSFPGGMFAFARMLGTVDEMEMDAPKKDRSPSKL